MTGPNIIIIRSVRRLPLFLVAFALLLFCQLIPANGVANAQSPAAKASLEDFLACQEIGKKKARYKCYDALEAGEAAPPSATAAPPTAAAVSAAEQKRQDFGRPAYAKEDKEDTALVVQVVSASLGRSGKWTFRTSDGQIWRQVNSRRARFREQSFEAEISKAPVSGFYLRPADQKLRLRVRRIK